jgi:succinate dehydrogenase/fumarate reductase flavoprotein subunit
MKANMEIVPIDTDVLVIGGGLAGCMAAIKATESGVRVTVAEKANTLSSGCAGTGVDHSWAYIPIVHGPMGYTLDDIVEDHCRLIAGNFINRDLLALVARENYDRMLDLEKFGIKIRFEDSRIPGKFRVVYQFHTVPSSFNFDGYNLKIVLTREARKRGVNIVNRVNMVSLLVSDGQIAGALGVGTSDGRPYLFRSKTVVVSTGRANRLTPTVTGVWGNHRIPVNETGDGRAMAFRAGLPVINMEFLSPGNYSIGNYELNLGSPRNTVQPAAAVTGADGEVYVPRTQFYDWESLGKVKVNARKLREEMFSGRRGARPFYDQLYREGKGPFYLDLTRGTEDEIKYIEWSIGNEGKGSLFLDYLKKQENFDFRRDRLEWLPNSREMAGTASSGLVVDNDLQTEVDGLFCAGDDVGGVPWSGAPGAFVMGWRAGENAARKASARKSLLPVASAEVDSLKEKCAGILENKKGMHWREVEMAVQNALDYYAGTVRAAGNLRRGAERLKFIRDNASFKASGPHELFRCLEVMSVMDNAQMVLAASLERRESRRMPFGFVRADFPEQDDRNWLAFLALRQRGGEIEFSRIPIGDDTTI